MIVDSGSVRTCISEPKARALGLEPSLLPRQSVGGIGGITSLPYAEDLVLYLLGEKLAGVLLERVMVLPLLRAPDGRAADLEPSSSAGEPYELNILGMDAGLQAKARLILDFALGQGRIEW